MTTTEGENPISQAILSVRGGRKISDDDYGNYEFNEGLVVTIENPTPLKIMEAKEELCNLEPLQAGMQEFVNERMRIRLEPFKSK